MKSADRKYRPKIWRRVSKVKIADNFKWDPYRSRKRSARHLLHNTRISPSPIRGTLNVLIQLNSPARHAFSPPFILRHARPLNPGLLNQRCRPRTAPRRCSPPPLVQQQPPLHQQPDFVTDVRLPPFRLADGAQAQRGCLRLDDQI